MADWASTVQTWFLIISSRNNFEGYCLLIALFPRYYLLFSVITCNSFNSVVTVYVDYNHL